MPAICRSGTEADGHTSQGSGTDRTIVIAPTNPEAVYVPAYNPNTVYGTWPYPAYPPTYYPPPPGYGYGSALLTGLMFGAGIAAAGAIFGGWNWGRGNSYVNVNVNRAVNIDRNFNVNNINNGRWQQTTSTARAWLSRSGDASALQPGAAGRRPASGVPGTPSRTNQPVGRPRRPNLPNRAGGGVAQRPNITNRAAGGQHPNFQNHAGAHARRRRHPWRQQWSAGQSRGRAAGRSNRGLPTHPTGQAEAAAPVVAEAANSMAVAATQEDGDERFSVQEGVAGSRPGRRPAAASAMGASAQSRQAARLPQRPRPPLTRSPTRSARRPKAVGALWAPAGATSCWAAPRTRIACARSLEALGRQPRGRRRRQQGHDPGRHHRLDAAHPDRQGRRPVALRRRGRPQGDHGAPHRAQRAVGHPEPAGAGRCRSMSTPHSIR